MNDSKNTELQSSKKIRIANPNAEVPKRRKGGYKTGKKYKTWTGKIRDAKTKEEKETVRALKKKAQAQRELTIAKKKLKELAKKPENEKVLEKIPEEIRQELEEEIKQDIIFEPNRGAQTEFLSANEDEVFYGGGKGGGKTFALIADPMRYFHNKNHNGLFIRRTMPELRDIIWHTKHIYPKAFPGAKFKVQESCWYFPSGARQEFGYAENLTDALRYQGKAYNWIGYDELPQYPDDSIYNLINTSARSIDPDLPVHIRATGNAGNVGSRWVKERFVEPSPSNKPFTVEVKYFDEREKKNKTRKITRRFIPSTVWDNPYYLYDDKYVASLASLPETQKKQLLEGDWDVVENMAFPEFSRNGPHVIEPFDIPRDWYKFRAADWGYASPFCCLWMAVNYENQIFVYREYYGKGILSDDWARHVSFLEKNERVWYGIIDSSTAQRRGETSPSIYETINKTLREMGRPAFRFADQSPNSRISGKQEMHKRLALRDVGLKNEKGEPVKEPSLFIFNTCTNLINQLSSLQVDPDEPEKVDTDAEDHAYDACRYGLQSRPANPATIMDMNQFREQNKPKTIDPIFGY